MNGGATILQLDPLTGRPSFVHGPRTSYRARVDISALNRERAHGIAKAIEANASPQSLPIDVRTTPFARTAEDLAVPLIPLEVLGIVFDEEEHIRSRFLRPLTAGAEAIPFADDVRGVVYKLFDLRDTDSEVPTGFLGKKLQLTFSNPWEGESVPVDATFFETLKKICVLHEAGAHPTEIVGLAESGDYLIVKQPLAVPHGPDLDVDRRFAAETMKAMPLRGGIRGTDLHVFWLDGESWLLGDLHRGNIMRDVDGQPTIIDALIGKVPLNAMDYQPTLVRAIQDARLLRDGGRSTGRRLFADTNEDEL